MWRIEIAGKQIPLEQDKVDQNGNQRGGKEWIDCEVRFRAGTHSGIQDLVAHIGISGIRDQKLS